MRAFYKSPLNPYHIRTRKSRHCDRGNSISQHLMILIGTRLGELPSLPDYGCKIWDYEFDYIKSRYIWKNEVADQLVDAIEKYEQRLTKVTVQISLSLVEASYALRKYPSAKEKAKILIQGTLSQTEESFYFLTDVYLSPISK